MREVRQRYCVREKRNWKLAIVVWSADLARSPSWPAVAAAAAAVTQSSEAIKVLTYVNPWCQFAAICLKFGTLSPCLNSVKCEHRDIPIFLVPV